MEMIDLRSEGPQAYTGARPQPRTSYTTPTPGESAVTFGLIIPVPLQKCIFCRVGQIHHYTPPAVAVEAAMCGHAAFWSDPDCEKDTLSTKPTSGKLASAYQDKRVFFTHSCNKEPTPACCAEGAYLGCSASFSVF